MSVLDKVSAFLDRVASLPYWQMAMLAALVVALLAGGYLILRPEPRPQGDFLSEEEVAQEVCGELTVYVAGAVRHPGVVRLEEGNRVVDAIEEAGGPLPDADLESLNLAQPVQDGQKILLPKQGESGAEGVGSGGKTEGGKVSINQASAKELEELPGIGPTLAERIIAFREKTGGFRSVEELKQVSGIGEKKFAELKELVEL
jgi:competence protein ComEA